mgnify:CR=1 FL=1
MLEIVKAPNPVLSQISNPVNSVDKSLLTLIEQMIEALEAASDPIGVGLAAPQVGKSLQIFIAKPKITSKILVFINPKIISKIPITQKNKGKKTARKLEGCLSLQDIWGEVIRNPEITVEYLDEKGRKHTKKFTGFMSTVIQHEIDHLYGILFPKRVLEQKGTLYKSEKDEKGEDIFDEIKI